MTVRLPKPYAPAAVATQPSLSFALCENSMSASASGTAAKHVVPRVPRAKISDTIGDVIAGLAGNQFDSTDAIYVLDDGTRLLGIFPLADLFAHSCDTEVRQVMSPALAVELGTDQEHVVWFASRHGLPSVPVIDAAGCFVGVVPGPALMEILAREHAEDVHRVAGIMAPSRPDSALESPIGRRCAHRLPWLVIGLLGSVAATAVMARFQHVLEANVIVALFVPAIVYLADAVGTQSEAVTVRYLSTGRPPLSRLLLGETATGFLISAFLGAIAFPAVLAWTGLPRLATAVTFAVIAAGTCAAAAGFLFPWLLSRLGKDPAFGSGPVATVIQDVVTLAIYFLLVVVLMP